MIKRIQETIKKNKIMEKKKVGQVTLEEKIKYKDYLREETVCKNYLKY